MIPSESNRPSPPGASRALAVRQSSAPARTDEVLVVDVEVVPDGRLGQPEPTTARTLPQAAAPGMQRLSATPAQRCAVYASLGVFVTAMLRWFVEMFVHVWAGFPALAAVLGVAAAFCAAAALGGWVWRGIELWRERRKTIS